MKKKPKSLQDLKIKSEVIKDSPLGGWSISYEELPQHDFSQIGEDTRANSVFYLMQEYKR
jgi:hypothetical protein